jgi:hypothetical protein
VRLCAVVEGRNDHTLLAGIAAPGDDDNASDFEAVGRVVSSCSVAWCVSAVGAAVEMCEIPSNLRSRNPANTGPRQSNKGRRGTHNFIVAVVRLVVGDGRGVRGCR